MHFLLHVQCCLLIQLSCAVNLMCYLQLTDNIQFEEVLHEDILLWVICFVSDLLSCARKRFTLKT